MEDLFYIHKFKVRTTYHTCSDFPYERDQSYKIYWKEKSMKELDCEKFIKEITRLNKRKELIVSRLCFLNPFSSEGLFLCRG